MNAKSITLRTVRNGSEYWLGQILYTDDGMIAGVTEYGNFAYAWRRTGGFEDFILTLDPEYFADKLEGEFLRLPASGKAAEKRANLIANQILRPLQEHIRAERSKAGAA